ncbi:MAG TPA: hypothetical protein VLJ42_10715 [Solirubrobacteraceae bacterium]|nr:hypothetical protein [Solirubrobacteraceae bacterium]
MQSNPRTPAARAASTRILSALAVLVLALACLASVGHAAAATVKGGAVKGGGVVAKEQASTLQGGVGDTPQGVSATLDQCTTAAAQTGRSATFAGQMVAVAGAQRMTMRIDVLQHTPGTPGFQPVTGQGLGVWRASAPGVKIYKYLKQVTNLPAPATFRALVRFRWLNAKGHPIKHAARHTAACEQPDLSAAPSSAAPAAGS